MREKNKHRRDGKRGNKESGSKWDYIYKAVSQSLQVKQAEAPERSYSVAGIIECQMGLNEE